jgi:hypothetical protein
MKTQEMMNYAWEHPSNGLPVTPVTDVNESPFANERKDTKNRASTQDTENVDLTDAINNGEHSITSHNVLQNGI